MEGPAGGDGGASSMYGGRGVCDGNHLLSVRRCNSRRHEKNFCVPAYMAVGRREIM